MAVTFDARTMDGYYLRNAFSMLKTETTVATMIVDKKYIRISLDTTKKTDKTQKTAVEAFVQYKFKFNAKRNFPGYSYNSPHDFESEAFSFMTSKMVEKAKAVTKRDGIRIYHVQGESQLYVRALKAGSNNPQSQGASFIELVRTEAIVASRKFDFPKEPDANMPVKEFCDRCSKAVAQGCKYLLVKLKDGVLSFQGILENGSVDFDEPYLISDEADETSDDDCQDSDETEDSQNPVLANNIASLHLPSQQSRFPVNQLSLPINSGSQSMGLQLHQQGKSSPSPPSLLQLQAPPFPPSQSMGVQLNLSQASSAQLHLFQAISGKSHFPDVAEVAHGSSGQLQMIKSQTQPLLGTGSQLQAPEAADTRIQAQGIQLQGTQPQGIQLQGTQPQGIQLQGTQPQGIQLQGTQPQGMQLQSIQLQASAAIAQSPHLGQTRRETADSREFVVKIPNTLCKIYAKHTTMCCNNNAIQDMYIDRKNGAMKISFDISVIGKYKTVVAN
jgi:hypothetical protein